MALMPEGLDERNYGGKFNVVEVGDKMVVDFSGVYALNQNGYTFVSDTLDIPIAPLALEVTGITVEDKVYDGTTDATVTGEPKIEGVCKDDGVTLKGTVTATFENAKEGKNKKVVLSGLTLAGDSSVVANYELVMPQLVASITAVESIGLGCSDSVCFSPHRVFFCAFCAFCALDAKFFGSPQFIKAERDFGAPLQAVADFVNLAVQVACVDVLLHVSGVVEN